MTDEDLPNYKVILAAEKVCVLCDANPEQCVGLAGDALLGKIDVKELMDKIKHEIKERNVVVDKPTEVLLDKLVESDVPTE